MIVLQLLPLSGAAALRVSGLTGPEVWEILEYVGRFNRLNTVGAGVKRAPVVAVEGAGGDDEDELGGGGGGGGEGEGGGGGELLLELLLLLLPLLVLAKTVDNLSSAACSSGENCNSPRRRSTKILQLRQREKN